MITECSCKMEVVDPKARLTCPSLTVLFSKDVVRAGDQVQQEAEPTNHKCSKFQDGRVGPKPGRALYHP
jgi:hypothetical protein